MPRRTKVTRSIWNGKQNIVNFYTRKQREGAESASKPEGDTHCVFPIGGEHDLDENNVCRKCNRKLYNHVVFSRSISPAPANPNEVLDIEIRQIWFNLYKEHFNDNGDMKLSDAAIRLYRIAYNAGIDKGTSEKRDWYDSGYEKGLEKTKGYNQTNYNLGFKEGYEKGKAEFVEKYPQSDKEKNTQIMSYDLGYAEGIQQGRSEMADEIEKTMDEVPVKFHPLSAEPLIGKETIRKAIAATRKKKED